MDKFKIDFEQNKRRKELLIKLYNENGLNANNFHCEKYLECKSSQKGNIENQYCGGTCALMPFYDLYYDGKPIRIMIIGKETGYMVNKKYGTSDDFFDNCKNVLNCINWRKKNNHMKGTLDTLKYIYGYDSEYLLSTYVLSNLMRCSFQKRERIDNVSAAHDTQIMRINCISYLMDEIKILQPTIIITQGEWALKCGFITAVEEYFNEDSEILLQSKNKKYGLYKFSKFVCIISHHPAIYGNWKKNLAPDSLFPMIDHLKKIGYIPAFDEIELEKLENRIKENIDKIIDNIANDNLRRRK